MNSRNGAAKSNETSYRNVYGIPFNLHDVCSNLITSRLCGHVAGHAYSVSLSVQLPSFFSIVCGAECWLGLTK